MGRRPAACPIRSSRLVSMTSPRGSPISPGTASCSWTRLTLSKASPSPSSGPTDRPRPSAGSASGDRRGTARLTMAEGVALDAVEPAALPRTMSALVKASPAPGAELREVPVPEPGPGELLVRVLAASVCGTDVHIERWDAWAQEQFRPPMIFGHEMAGVVVGHGSGAGRVALGELVAAETHLVDWTCYQCRTGRAHVC